MQEWSLGLSTGQPSDRSVEERCGGAIAVVRRASRHILVPVIAWRTLWGASDRRRRVEEGRTALRGVAARASRQSRRRRSLTGHEWVRGSPLTHERCRAAPTGAAQQSPHLVGG